jgi:hypothetical protein
LSLRWLLVRRIPYAILLAATLVVGTLIGGAAYEAANPAFERITWVEHAGADAAGGSSIRRSLFADGRFLALTPDGYQAGILASAATNEIFDTVRVGAKSWRSSYEANGVTGERIELALEGPAAGRVAIANPMMNFELPSDLGRVLRLLSAADASVARVAFTPSSLRFSAVVLPNAPDGPLEAVPLGFPIAAATRPGGVPISGGELAILKSFWTDLDTRLDPGHAHRFVEHDGQRWQISWALDLDAIGPLSPSSVVP